MQLASSARIPDGFMAAMRLGAKNRIRGFRAEIRPLYQGPTGCQLHDRIRLARTAELNRVGSCSTGKERDSESGNDYFPARYYASSMGRWTSPDPSGLYLADPENPQTLNLYSYVVNNPLRFVDPDGLQADPAATQGWLRLC